MNSTKLLYSKAAWEISAKNPVTRVNCWFIQNDGPPSIVVWITL